MQNSSTRLSDWDTPSLSPLRSSLIGYKHCNNLWMGKSDQSQDSLHYSEIMLQSVRPIICLNGSKFLGKSSPLNSGRPYGPRQTKALFVLFLRKTQSAISLVHDPYPPYNHQPQITIKCHRNHGTLVQIYWQHPSLQPYWRSVQDLLHQLFELDIPLHPKIPGLPPPHNYLD